MDLDGINHPSTSHVKRPGKRNVCFKIIAKLEGSGVANSVLSSVVESMEEYVSEVHENLKEQECCVCHKSQ